MAKANENYRIRELAEIVGATVPGCTIELAGDAGPDARNYRVDASKIAASLPGFAPTWTAADGARELYEAFKERASRSMTSRAGATAGWDRSSGSSTLS